MEFLYVQGDNPQTLYLVIQGTLGLVDVPSQRGRRSTKEKAEDGEAQTPVRPPETSALLSEVWPRHTPEKQHRNTFLARRRQARLRRNDCDSWHCSRNNARFLGEDLTETEARRNMSPYALINH